MWERIDDVIYSIPAHFETELLIKGINVTEIFSVGGAFASVVENQVVNILNSLRNIWDPDSEYADYAFVRQSQTFPEDRRPMAKNFVKQPQIYRAELLQPRKNLTFKRGRNEQHRHHTHPCLGG